MGMKVIPLARFNAIFGYARAPHSVEFGVEREWYESDDRQVLGALIEDADGEFSVIFFARDLAGRFRWIRQTEFMDDADDAVTTARNLLPVLVQQLPTLRVQGDEGKPLDLVTPVRPQRALDPKFIALTQNAGYSPAFEIISHIMPWFKDGDGNFIEQFQTNGFDARLWEMYLHTMLTEAGYVVDRPKPAPDFLARGARGSFAIEATTINPSILDGGPAPSQVPTDPAEMKNYLENYLATRYAGPLTAKLGKRYWEHPDVAGLPLAIAVQDFHDGAAMTFSGGSLQTYLYGQAIDDERTPEARQIDRHPWGTKIVESNFFSLNDAEHISAVLFNGAATLSKFVRMGSAAGLGRKSLTVVHSGVRFNGPSGARVLFNEEVHEGYPERWVDGLNVFHNPRAKLPLDRGLIRGAAHHIWTGDRFEMFYSDGHLESMRTLILNAVKSGSDDTDLEDAAK